MNSFRSGLWFGLFAGVSVAWATVIMMNLVYRHNEGVMADKIVERVDQRVADKIRELNFIIRK